MNINKQILQEIELDNKKKFAEIATLVEEIKLNNKLIERYEKIETNTVLKNNPIPNIDNTNLSENLKLTYASHDIDETVYEC